MPEGAPAPTVLDLPVGLDATGLRREHDSLGEVLVPADRYWGAQTQRSLENFAIGEDRMPLELHHALAQVKRAAALVNVREGRLPGWLGALIVRVCDEVVAGELDDQFPLSVWQTGSGTQSNMNVNEVVANRALQLLGAPLGSQDPVHPNDHVNMAQSSNDIVPTAMHLAARRMVRGRTVPALRALQSALEQKSARWAGIVKVGRTHLQDAVPLTVGQEWSGYAAALADATDALEHATDGLLELAIGGTAVGTGLNAPPGFGAAVAAELAASTGEAYVVARNPFAALGTLDRMVRAHAGLKAVAVSLFKIANDVRWLGSGPRAGLHELVLPANEPGSSIMPGKVNPTQAEAMLMVTVQVIASDVAVTMGGAEGNLELNTFRPLLIDRHLHSARLLADMSDSFRRHLVEGTEVDEAAVRADVERSVMAVTALSPVIGYDRAAAIAHHAVEAGLTLREAALAAGVPAQTYDRVVDPLAMTRGGVPQPQTGADGPTTTAP